MQTFETGALPTACLDPQIRLLCLMESHTIFTHCEQFEGPGGVFGRFASFLAILHFVVWLGDLKLRVLVEGAWAVFHRALQITGLQTLLRAP